jgi:hypothetical protein
VSPLPRDVLTLYDTGFRHKFGVKAPITMGKDAAIAKWLLSQYSLEQIGQWFDGFFASRDPFIINSGYSMGVFKACLPKIIVSAVRQAPAVQRYICCACKVKSVDKLGNYCDGCREQRL